MYSSTRKGTEGIMLAVAEGLRKDGTLVSCRRRMAAVLASVPWLDSTSRADIMREGMAVARRGLLEKKGGLPRFVSSNLYDVMKAWNRAYKRLWVRTKRTQVETGMRLQRGREEPIVFYLVSSHQKPQKAHEPLQGELLIDPKWRTVLSGDALERVGRFVRARRIRSVRWAMGEPHYLLVRPNCRHVLYPVKTEDALLLGERALKAKYQPRRTGVHRPITDAQRAQAYRELRASVFEKASKLAGLNLGAN